MTTIHELFDAVCFSTGDLDAIAPTPPLEPICYFEVQALSESLAAQVHHRFRPQATQTVLLLQLDGNTLLEAISVLAASRLKLPWITLEEMRSSHLEIIAEDLRRAGGYQTLLAIVQASGDEDFKCQTMFKAGVHKVLCMNDYGMINNSMNVPSSLPTPPETSSSDDLYIMFTSGTSGGTPKAVVGSTKSTIKRLQWFNDQFSVGGTRVARKTDLAFVDGVTELLSALLYGGCLVDIEHWKGLPERVDIDRVTLLPSQLEQLLRIVEDGEVGTKSSIGMICLSGEICPHAVAASKHFGGEKGYFRKTMLLNLYGQTETTGDVTYYCLRNGPKKGECCVNWIEEGDGIVPVGRPWAENVKIIIEDGEIVLLVDENSSFSNGYLRNNENGNSETYNTGDEGFLKDGILYVTGRVGGISSGKVNGKMVVASEAEYSLHMDGGLPGVRVIVHKNCCWAFVLNSVDADANAVKKLRGKMPLHLAPRKVFVLGEFPLCARAAGKIDNMRLKQIVDDWVSGNVAEVGDDNNNNNAFMNLVKAQLGVDDIDSSHSFVENGGDSMLAVTFLHSLKKAKKVKGMKGELKMSDVLGAESLNDLERIWKGEGRAKRRKVDVPSPPSSQFTPVVEVDEDTGGAWSVSFKACVDSGPVFVNRGEQKLVIAGCQGGSFLAIDMVTKSVVGAQALEGAVEGAAVVDDDKVFVASYKKEGGRSWVSCFNVTLETLIWRTQLDGALVKSSVVLSGSSGCLFVAGGDFVWRLTMDSGVIEWVSELKKANIYTSPVIVSDEKELMLFSSELEEAWKLDFASGKVLDSLVEGIDPVFAGALRMEGEIYWGDLYGKINRLGFGGGVVSSQMSYSPCFSGPRKFGEDGSGSVLLGSHDGQIRCYDKDLNLLFEYSVGAVVRSRCLVANNNTVYVSTTAGEVLKLAVESVEVEGDDGGVYYTMEQIGRKLLEGEIWCDACLCFDGTLAVGCRDSKLWFVKL